MAKTENLDPIVSAWVTRSFCRLLSVFSILQGFFIFIEGQERWSEPSYRAALLVPGSPDSWGYVILAAGVVSLTGSILGKNLLITIGSYLASAWCGLFGIFFLAGVILYKIPATTSVASYLTLSILFAMIGVVYRDSK